MTVDYILTTFYAKLSIPFKLCQQNLVYFYAVFKGKDKGVAIWTDGWSKNRSSFSLSNGKLATQDILIFFEAPKSHNTWSCKHSQSLSGWNSDIACLLSSAAAFYSQEDHLWMRSIKANVLAFPCVEIIFCCSYNHFFVAMVQIHFMDHVPMRELYSNFSLFDECNLVAFFDVNINCLVLGQH